MEKLKEYIRFIITSSISVLGRILFRSKIDYGHLFNYNKILVIRLDEIGDVVMTTPLLRELRKNYPNAHITLLVKSQVYNLVELCPYVDKILTYDKVSGKYSFLSNMIKTFFFCKKYLIKEKYDLSIVPRWDVDSYFASVISYFSGAKFRIGYSENVNHIKKSTNRGYDKYFTKTINDENLKHENIRNLEFIKFLGGDITDNRLEVWTDQSDTSFAMKLISNFIKKECCVVVAVFPEAGSKRREWGSNQYIALINSMQKNYNVNFILLGNKMNDEFDKIVNCTDKDILLNCIGKTTLRQTIAILKKCSFYLGGDTGPMHLAAAVHLDGVIISCHPQNGDPYHVNSIDRFGPWQSKMKVIQPERGLDDCKDGCNKEYAHCINQITVEEVFQAVSDILDKKIPGDHKMNADKTG